MICLSGHLVTKKGNFGYSFQVKRGAERAFRYLPQKETKDRLYS